MVWYDAEAKKTNRASQQRWDSCEQVRHRITEIRQERGISQKEMSRRVGISRSSYTQIENGYRRLDLVYLFMMVLSALSPPNCSKESDLRHQMTTPPPETNGRRRSLFLARTARVCKVRRASADRAWPLLRQDRAQVLCSLMP